MGETTLRSPTFRLFALPSFLEGVGSLVDLSGSFHAHDESPTPAEADRDSLRADWIAIGMDMQAAIDKAREELNLA